MWKKAVLSVQIPWSQWHAIFNFKPTLAHPIPTADDFAKSEVTKASDSYFDLVHAQNDKPYWISAEVTPEQLNASRNQNANILSLGYFGGQFKAWIDNKLYLESEKNLAEIPISMDRLKEPRPLSITFQVSNVGEWNYPDLMEMFYDGVGFVTFESAAAHRNIRSFFIDTRPLILFIFNFLVAITFYFFWTSSPKKQEYFAMSAYCFVLALSQAGFISTFMRILPSTFIYKYELVGMFAQGIALLSLALSFARIKKQVYQNTITGATLVPVIIMLTHHTNNNMVTNSMVTDVVRVFVPTMAMIGAVICGLQLAFVLLSKNIDKLSKSKRARRLLFFTAGISAIAFVYVVEAGFFQTPTRLTIWNSFVHIGVVLFLGAVVIADYRETEEKLEKTPISKFHTPEFLNQPINGVVVSLDLKNSETLLQYGAALGDSSRLFFEATKVLRKSLIE